MTKQTRILLLVVILIAVLAGFGQYLISRKSITSPKTVAKVSIIYTPDTSYEKSTNLSPSPYKNAVSIWIEFGDGKVITGETFATTVYEALAEIAKTNDLTVETKQYKYGMIVERIGKDKNEQGKYWLYSINGKMAEIAADKYLVYPKDKIVWTYGK